MIVMCVLQMERSYELPDVSEGWEQLTLVIEPFRKEVSDTFDVSVEIPRNKWEKREQDEHQLSVW